MTPSDIITAARDLYNATSDTFYSDTQIYNWIWQGCHEFCKKTWMVETLTSASTVAGTQSYAYPTNAIAIKRITVNGKKIKRITQRDDDAITLSNQAVTTQGQPIYYYDFGNTVYLRPIPDAVYTMVTYYYSDQPQITSGTTTIVIPAVFHFDLVDYVLYRMFMKDKDIENGQFHLTAWMLHVKDALSMQKRLKRTDSFATVQSEDNLPVTILGEA